VRQIKALSGRRLAEIPVNGRVRGDKPTLARPSGI